MASITPLFKKQCTKESNITSNSNYALPEPHELSYERSHVSSIEDVYETPNEPFKTLIKQLLQTRQVCEALYNQLKALEQKYVNMLLGGDREKAIDHDYISARTARCLVTNLSM